ncbi:MAG TPA: hypothetical protein VFU22_21080 [Roseiflexaceae bacterium]|nr:hypothetical protein [Roseiflexaceae bacterium]
MTTPTSPSPSMYDAFVQSTSYNRVLKRLTRFLYEVEDWDRGVELRAAA